MRSLADLGTTSGGPTAPARVANPSWTVRRTRRNPGLRRRLVVSLGAGSLLLALFLSTGTYALARGYLVDVRERSATRGAVADAVVVREGLRTAGRPVSEVLGELSADAGTVLALRRGNVWYGSALDGSGQDVPVALRDAVAQGRVVHAWTALDGSPAVVVGIPLPGVTAELYEIRAATELQQTLDTLRVVLAILTLVTAGAGALAGRRVAALVMAPLQAVGAAAGRIAAGDLDTRLAATDDPDLSAIVGSFNAMVDTLDERLDRDARFAADVSHELRTPLMSLVTSVDVLRRRAQTLPAGSDRLLDVVASELTRFRRLLEDLIELARIESATSGTSPSAEVDVRDLIRHALLETGREPDVLVPGDTAVVAAEPRMLRRAFVNLFDNADAHGGGLVRVRVRATGGDVLVDVEDTGDGVAPPDRERIFERFARAAHRSTTPGSGLGLSLVREIARRHDGDVWCSSAPEAGARFTVRLPRSAQGTGA